MATALEILKAVTIEEFQKVFKPDTIPQNYTKVVQKLEELTPESCKLKIVVGKDEEGDHEVYGEDEEGKQFALDLLPWEEWRDSEIHVEIDISPPYLAALIYNEITLMNEDFDKRQRMVDSLMGEALGIAGNKDFTDFREISPGVLLSPQVQAAMEKDGKIHKLMSNLTYDEIMKNSKPLSD